MAITYCLIMLLYISPYRRLLQRFIRIAYGSGCYTSG
nr:MAG TPA: hypothetical protein [Bacteriophage sp.]